ncbi:MAG: cation-efflux pump, partial [Cyanobacteria bacterium J06635_15]
MTLAASNICDLRATSKYRYQKFEAVGALGIAAFLGIACFEILKGAVERLIFGGEPVEMSAIAVWFMLIKKSLSMHLTSL